MTLGDLIQDVIADSRGDATAEEAGKAVLAAVAHHARERWPWNEGWSTALTAAGQDYYDLPCDALVLDGLTLIRDDGEVSVCRVPPARLEAARPCLGPPQMWAVYAKRFRVWPAPDAAYVLRLSYVQRLPALDADDDCNAWTCEAAELVKYTALMRLYAGPIRDAEGLGLATAAASAARASLRRWASERSATGGIVPTEF